jgi:hypothetical protein
MANITDFTEKNIKILYEDFNRAKGITIEQSDDITCLKFQTTSWEQIPRPSRVSQTICYRHSTASLLTKKFFDHEKFFDKVTGVLLGDSRVSAIKELPRLGVENFVRGDVGEAARFFGAAYKNAEVGSDEESLNKELLDVVLTLNEADEELAMKSWNNYVLKMQNAYMNCPNATIKSIVGDRRNGQAEKFSAIAETFFSERNFEEAANFNRLAFKLCTEEYPKKEEFEAVMRLSHLEFYFHFFIIKF